MRQLSKLSPAIVISAALTVAGCGGPQPADSPADASGDSSETTGGDAEGGATSANGQESEANGDNVFAVNQGTGTAQDAQGVSESKLKPTDDETVVKFLIVDRGNENAPMPGIVVKLEGPDGETYYTAESDAKGYAEALVPKGRKYELTYLSLGRKDIEAEVPVPDKPRQTLKLTLRYKKIMPPKPDPKVGQGTKVEQSERGFILTGVTFDTGKATIRPESHERLESVIEFMKHKKSARIEISGHTDNVGKPGDNQGLSERRAKAVRQYLIDQGIEGDRIEAVGYGQDRPVASNETPEGRQKNRRIEAREL